MKKLKTLAAAALCLLALCLPSVAATATLMLRVAPGPSYSGLASSVQVTVYDNTHTALTTNSNTPDGVHSFAEEGSTGSYWALYAVDTSKLPLSYTTTISGQGLVFPPVTIGADRAIQIADGYTAALPATLATASAQATLQTAVNALPSSSAVATAVWAGGNRTLTAQSDSPGVGTLLTNVGTVLTRLGTPSGASIDADILSRLAAGNVTVGGYATGQDPAALLNSLIAGIPAASASALMTKSIGHGMTFGQLLSGLQAADLKVAAITNTWHADTHVLDTAYQFGGDSGPTLTTHTQYPVSQVSNPAISGITTTVGTVFQP